MGLGPDRNGGLKSALANVHAHARGTYDHDEPAPAHRGGPQGAQRFDGGRSPSEERSSLKGRTRACRGCLRKDPGPAKAALNCGSTASPAVRPPQSGAVRVARGREERTVFSPLTKILVRASPGLRFPVNIALTGWGARSSSDGRETSLLDCRWSRLHSRRGGRAKPLRPIEADCAHAKVATVASSAWRNEGLGGINISNLYAPPSAPAKRRLRHFRQMTLVRFGVSDSLAGAQVPGKEIEGLEVLT
jgi:hypothetical protein